MRETTPGSLAHFGAFVIWSPVDQAYAAQAMIAASHVGEFNLSPRNAMLLTRFVVDIHEGRTASQAVCVEVSRLLEVYDECRRLASSSIL